MRDSMDRGVDWGHDFLGRVGGVDGVVDVGGLNDLLDGVDLVGSSHGDSTGNSDLIGLGNMLVDNNFTSNRGGHMDRDINIVLLHIELRDDVGGLGGDSDMGPHRGQDLLLGDSVSRGRSKVPGSGGDGSQGCWGSRDGWGSNGDSDLGVLGRASNIGCSRLGDMLNTSNSILMSSNNALHSGLDNLVSNNAILSVLLHSWGTSSIGLVSLSHNSGGRDHWGTSI